MKLWGSLGKSNGRLRKRGRWRSRGEKLGRFGVRPPPWTITGGGRWQMSSEGERRSLGDVLGGRGFWIRTVPFCWIRSNRTVQIRSWTQDSKRHHFRDHATSFWGLWRPNEMGRVWGWAKARFWAWKRRPSSLLNSSALYSFVLKLVFKINPLNYYSNHQLVFCKLNLIGYFIK